MTDPQQKREKKLLYLDESTPEEFQNAELMDWIYLVGDITTPYELDFVRQFGHALRPRPAPAVDSCQTCLSEMATFCKNCPHVNENTREKAQQHDTSLIKQAKREGYNEALDEMIELAKCGKCPFPKKRAIVCESTNDFECIPCLANSLRSTTAKEERR